MKKLLCDRVNLDKDLGHSGNKQTSTMGNNDHHSTTSDKEVDCIECKKQQDDQPTTQHITTRNMEKQPDQQSSQSPVPSIFYKHNHLSIEYSIGSSIDSLENILYRATYYTSELLSMI